LLLLAVSRCVLQQYMLPVVVYKSAGFLITDKTVGIKSMLIKVTDVSLFKQFIETRN